MRRISKPWPPGDVYPDGQAQYSLRQAETVYQAALAAARDHVSFARSEFDKLAKHKLRARMYSEQRSLCIYCEQRISEGFPGPRIDHWRPLSLDPSLALHWNNLYLSCPFPHSCDSAKGDRPFRWDYTDPDMPWPVRIPYEDIVGFTRGGEMYVRSDVALPSATRRALELAIGDRPHGAQLRHAIVNLNHPALVTARASAVDSERTRLERDFRNATATRSERDSRAAQLLRQDPRPTFVSIRVAWLRQVLGHGR